MTAPSNVGILAMEMYFPKRYVAQSDMEIANNCIGKYTKGLGQVNMAFVDDIEDINSIFLTVTANLLEKYNIDPNDIGRLEIGTETLIDKAKSVKTTLTRLFGNNTELEGVSNVNACYGGTAALFNCMDWLRSPDWNGKYALLVCGDIAVYAEGPARCTGGCGSIAILLGPNAPLVFEPGVRSTHSIDVYDFYKPSNSEYAKVNGTLSQWVYLSSVDTCYTRYKAKYNKLHPNESPMSLDKIDYFAYHSPYNKLVQKGFSRLFYMDFRDTPNKSGYESALEVQDLPLEQSYDNAGKVEMIFRNISAARWESDLMPSCTINRSIGNCYSASVFSSILSLICEKGNALVDKRVLAFSYGSGSMASVYSFVGRVPLTEVGDGMSPFSLDRIQNTVNVKDRLERRRACDVNEFNSSLNTRERQYGKAPMTPEGSVDNLWPGSYYLTGVTADYITSYERTPL